jgi:hypothetical protein
MHKQTIYIVHNSNLPDLLLLIRNRSNARCFWIAFGYRYQWFYHLRRMLERDWSRPSGIIYSKLYTLAFFDQGFCRFRPSRGALIAVAMILVQQNEASRPKVASIRELNETSLKIITRKLWQKISWSRNYCTATGSGCFCRFSAPRRGLFIQARLYL